jgi:hypothetical protein
MEFKRPTPTPETRMARLFENFAYFQTAAYLRASRSSFQLLNNFQDPHTKQQKSFFLKGFGTQRVLTNRSGERSSRENMKTIVKVGLYLLAAGFMASSLSVTAADQLDSWKVRGLTRPGAWFAKNTTEKPVTIALSKSGQGVGMQKRTKSQANK